MATDQGINIANTIDNLFILMNVDYKLLNKRSKKKADIDIIRGKYDSR
jgi:hypothetical protein